MPTKRQILTIAAFVSILINALPATAQTTNGPDETANRKALAEAEIKEYEARLKQLEVQGKMFEMGQKQIAALTGNPTAKGDAIETELLAFETVKCLAGKVWERIPTGAKTLVYYDPTAAVSIVEYRSLSTRINLLTKDFKSVFGEQTNWKPMLIDPGSALAISGIASSILSIFKSDIGIEGKSYTLPKDAFLASFASLKPAGITIFDPARFTPSAVPGDKSLLKRLEDLNELRRESEGLEPLLKLDAKIRQRPTLVASIANETDPEAKAKLEAKLRTLDREILDYRTALQIPDTTDNAAVQRIASVLRNAQSGTDAIFIKLGLSYSADAKQAVSSSLIDYLKGEALDETFKANTAYWLDVNLTRMGGTVRTRKDIFTGVFDKKGQITFSGGSAASFNFINKDGTIERSGIVTHYTPFQRVGTTISVECPAPK